MVALAEEGARITALDGLRGIAILLVLLLHLTTFGQFRPTAGIDIVYRRIASVGWIGVDLFFVLSGFLITGILLEAKGRPGFFSTFYTRRVLRIFPLYYVFLALFFFVLIPLFPGLGFGHLTGEQGWQWFYLQNFKLARDGWDPPPAPLGHLWSLAVEEQFYLLWPLVVFACSPRALTLICVVIVVVCPVLRTALHIEGNAVAAYALMPARMDTLAFGALLAILARQPGGLARALGWLKPLGWGATLVLLAMAAWKHRLDSEGLVVQAAGYTLLALSFGAVLAVAATAPSAGRTHRLFASPVLVFFGKYSYGIYILHQPLLACFQQIGFTARAVAPVFGSRLPGVLLFSAIGGIASVGLALLSWRLVEQPFLSLKRHFRYRSARMELARTRRGLRVWRAVAGRLWYTPRASSGNARQYGGAEAWMGPRTILFVSPEPGVCSVVGRVLREDRYRVMQASDGLTALRLLEQHPAIDLVITDTRVPVLNAWQFARAARQLHPCLPILRVAAPSEERPMDGLVELPLLAKPFTVLQLLGTVRELLKPAREWPRCAEHLGYVRWTLPPRWPEACAAV
jgi:peptidoglycan/LPS O-acetylase OafA/YrhL